MLNKTTVIGNLGADCTCSVVNGLNVINFNLCVTERYKDQQGVQKEISSWFSASYWCKSTAIAPYLKKGTMIYAEGKVEAKIYKNKEGVQVPQLSFRVSHIELLSKPKDTNQPENIPPSSNDSLSADDLPF